MHVYCDLIVYSTCIRSGDRLTVNNTCNLYFIITRRDTDNILRNWVFKLARGINCVFAVFAWVFIKFMPGNQLFFYMFYAVSTVLIGY